MGLAPPGRAARPVGDPYIYIYRKLDEGGSFKWMVMRRNFQEWGPPLRESPNNVVKYFYSA